MKKIPGDKNIISSLQFALLQSINNHCYSSNNLMNIAEVIYS